MVGILQRSAGAGAPPIVSPCQRARLSAATHGFGLARTRLARHRAGSAPEIFAGRSRPPHQPWRKTRSSDANAPAKRRRVTTSVLTGTIGCFAHQHVASNTFLASVVFL